MKYQPIPQASIDPSPDTSILLTINVGLHYLFGMYGFILRWGGETYTSSNNISSAVLSNSGWIGVYCALLILSMITGVLVEKHLQGVCCAISFYLRFFLLITIISVNASDTTVFKIGEFYTDVFHFACIYEPALLVILYLYDEMKKELKGHKD